MRHNSEPDRHNHDCAVAVAAFAAWQARSSAAASRDAVRELRAARDQDARSQRLHRLEAIRQMVIRMKDLAERGQAGSEMLRALQTDLRGALPPPVGTLELIACMNLAKADRDDEQLASWAL